MKKIIVILSVLAALLALVACNPSGGQEPIAADATEPAATDAAPEEETVMEDSMLQGVRWVLVSYLNAAGETAEALADREVTAEFNTDGQLGGSAGCNRYFASYTVDGSALTIGQAGSTMMACEPAEVMEQEAQFLAALTTAAGWHVEGNQLHILDANGQTVALFAASEPASLTGGTWSATGINNGKQAVTSLVIDTTVTAVFSEDGQLNGSAGCNNFMTSYTLDGQNITIEPAATTRKMCPGEGVMEQETQFLTALTTATTWNISGEVLELRTADGALAVSFTIQPAE